MGKRRSNPILISLLVVGAIAGCAKKESIRSQGGEDSGGGSVAYSTETQVNSSIDLAIKMATEPNHRMNVYAQFFMDSGKNSSYEFIRKPDHLFPAIGDVDSIADLSDPANVSKFGSPYLEALSKNRLDRRLKGDCLTTVAGEYKDAAVSRLSLSADICLSIGNLTRVPPSALLREVMGLLLHEAVHMAGAEEPEASAWQKEFSEYFGKRFGDIVADTVTSETLKSIGAAQILIKRAKDAAAVNGKDPKIYGWVGRAAQIIVGLPDLLDPLALNLKMKSIKPELYSNYANAALAFVSEAQVRFELPPIIPLYLGKLNNPTFAFPGLGVGSAEQVQNTVAKLTKLLEQTNENFLALTGAEGAISVCVKPGSQLSKQNFNHSVHKPVFPQASCPP